MDNYKEFLDLGIIDIRNGKFRDGIEKINQSLELKKDWEIPYFYRAVAYHALEEFDNAILDYTKAISINENMTDAYYNRAKIILSRKDIENPNIEKAIQDLEIALKLDPNFVDALYAMSAAQLKVRNYHVALEYLEKQLRLQPDSVNARALKKLIQNKYLKLST